VGGRRKIRRNRLKFRICLSGKYQVEPLVKFLKIKPTLGGCLAQRLGNTLTV
jgi:hypothetical protein